MEQVVLKFGALVIGILGQSGIWPDVFCCSEAAWSYFNCMQQTVITVGLRV